MNRYILNVPVFFCYRTYAQLSFRAVFAHASCACEISLAKPRFLTPFEMTCARQVLKSKRRGIYKIPRRFVWMLYINTRFCTMRKRPLINAASVNVALPAGFMPLT